MKCGHCGKELYFQDEQMKLTECPFCHQDLNATAKGLSSTPKSSISIEGKGQLMHVLAFVLIVVQYLIWICNPAESGMSFDFGNFFLIAVVVCCAFGWMAKGSVIPVLALTLLNIVLFCFFVSEGFKGLGFAVLLFIANGVLFTPSAFAWRKRSGAVSASLVCPHCGSELPNENVSVCSGCGKSVKFIDGTKPEFIKEDTPSAVVGDVSERLMKLKTLKDAGVLTDDEYEKKRAELVKEL